MATKKSIFAGSAIFVLFIHLLLLIFGNDYYWWNFPTVGASFNDVFELFNLWDYVNNTKLKLISRSLTLFSIGKISFSKKRTKSPYIFIIASLVIPSVFSMISIVFSIKHNGYADYDDYFMLLPLSSFLTMIFLCILEMIKTNLNRTLYNIICFIPSISYLLYFSFYILIDYFDYSQYDNGTNDWYGLSEILKSILMIVLMILMGLYFVASHRNSITNDISLEKQS